jgi:hypothetical protein
MIVKRFGTQPIEPELSIPDLQLAQIVVRTISVELGENLANSIQI